LKKFLRWLLGVSIFLIIIVVSLIGPVDFTPLSEQPFYQNTMKELEEIQPLHHLGKLPLRTSWDAINITPHSPMPMAGYAPRHHFDKVHDSIYVRILGIDNGSVRCFIISADLLLFPPALKNKIEAKISTENRFLYFAASHAHSSLGAWNDSVIGNLILGSYNDQWVDSLAGKVVSSIEVLEGSMKSSSISYFETDAREYVENRIDSEKGEVDGFLRGFKITREDGTKALFTTYSAHPTNISHLSLELSGDYPNSLIKKAESNGYTFAMFGAGMVGSHRVKWMEEREFVLCDTLAARLFRKIQVSEHDNLVDAADISTAVFPLHYGPSQLHVLQKFKVRDWAFRGLFTTLKGEINYLRIGNIVMLGTPCDFSGEIFTREGLRKIAEAKHEKLFITSFNGEYVGYITSDDHYGHSEQEEVMAMNWVGPFYGEYYSRVIKKILEKN
jgi:neutral ceramidase